MEGLLYRGLISAVYAGAFAWIVFSRYNVERGYKKKEGKHPKYLPYIPGNILPIYIAVLFTAFIALYGFLAAGKMMISLFFGIFLHIAVYYMVLILLMPLLRRQISARACAMLWMIPNYLYVTTQLYVDLPEPLYIITIPVQIVWLVIIWLIGFLGVLSYKIIQHLRFRAYVMKDAVPVQKEKIFSVWRDTLKEARIKEPKFQLYMSPHVKTPLSIGLFQRSTKVILPEREYEQEELQLILRHEIIHVSRQDAWSKFFLVFCTAICWFNPVMWVAMRKSAEDLELSCDETVLLSADSATRHQYASLLLETAGDERGFTTCLSASAKSMRYRLQGITKPRMVKSGAFAVGIMGFLMFFTSGYIALAYGGEHLGPFLYPDGDMDSCHFSNAGYRIDNILMDRTLRDEEALCSYLSDLAVMDMTGFYSFPESERRLSCFLQTPQNLKLLCLYDKTIQVVTLSKQGESSLYYVPEGIDWAYIDSLMTGSADIAFDTEG